jgi:hypothetical protein
MTIVPLVVGYFAIQWNRANFLGKTPEQMVAMGREKWSELYGKKFGLSTHRICDAEEKYGIALKNLNDRAIKKLPKTRQIWLNQVRKSTQEYATEAHQIGSLMTGGGTIWQTFDATIFPDVEQTISDCIVNKPLPPVKKKSFNADIEELDQIIGKAKADQDDKRYSDLLDHRKTLIAKQSQLLELLSKGHQADSTRFQLYMHRKIQVARGDNLDE